VHKFDLFVCDTSNFADNVCQADVMLMSDHICMPGLGGKHPLVGHNDDNYGVRFPVSLASY
jgi:hypothetical protein